MFGHGETFSSYPYITRECNETIFEYSHSVRYTHRSNSREWVDNYSKAQIIKIISPRGWGINPYFEKTFVGYLAYPIFSYYDYQEAWFKSF